MEKKRIIMRFLQDIGALISNSHIVYTSWQHGSAYMNKDKIFPFTISTATLSEEVAHDFIQNGASVVIGPGTNGAKLAHGVAIELTKMDGREILATYADKTDNGGLVIRHGFHNLIKGEKVLIVDTNITKNGMTSKLVKVVRKAGGIIIGVSGICNRGVTQEDLNVPKLRSLIDMEVWDENECPLCKRNVPINTNVGRGREFLEQRKFLKEKTEQHI